MEVISRPSISIILMRVFGLNWPVGKRLQLVSGTATAAAPYQPQTSSGFITVKGSNYNPL